MNMELANDYYLERYVLGELSEEESQIIQRLATENPDIQSKLDGFESSNREILALYPPAPFKASLLSEMEKRKSDLKEGRISKITPLIIPIFSHYALKVLYIKI